MTGLPDHEFQTPGTPSGSAGGGSRIPRAALIAGLVVVIGVGAYLFFRARGTSPESTQPATAANAPAPAPPLAEGADRYDLPPLEDSDDFMRERIGTLTSDPLVAAWLTTNGLVRNLVLVVENTARGLTPAKHLRVLKPAGTFRVVTRGDQVLIDPRNYDRFARVGDAAASIDAARAARMYGGLKPLLQMAYDELGNQEPFDRAVERAIVGLLQAPVVEGDVRVEAGGEGIGYQFVDAKLEELTPAQKQLVRMGPRNMRIIQDRLRQFALALGIPASRLPAA